MTNTNQTTTTTWAITANAGLWDEEINAWVLPHQRYTTPTAYATEAEAEAVREEFADDVVAEVLAWDAENQCPA